MRFVEFTISNFKGIEKADIPLKPHGAGIYTLIGLNESGKTTILEALSMFSNNTMETKALYANDFSVDDPRKFIPKGKISNFTGNITVSARICMSEQERKEIINTIEKAHSCKVDIESIPLEMYATRGFRFLNSDLAGSINTITSGLSFKRKGKRKAQRAAADDDLEWKTFASCFNNLMTKIVYFPTFLFAQPQKIYLFDVNGRKRESAVNRQYREMLENVAFSLDDPWTFKSIW